MITKENLKESLTLEGFIQNENQVYSKLFENIKTEMKVDFKNQLLIFPKEILGEERNNTFYRSKSINEKIK